MPEIDKLDVGVYTVPAEEPESDGTFGRTSTTVVVVEPSVGAPPLRGHLALVGTVNRVPFLAVPRRGSRSSYDYEAVVPTSEFGGFHDSDRCCDAAATATSPG